MARLASEHHPFRDLTGELTKMATHSCSHHRGRVFRPGTVVTGTQGPKLLDLTAFPEGKNEGSSFYLSSVCGKEKFLADIHDGYIFLI